MIGRVVLANGGRKAIQAKRRTVKGSSYRRVHKESNESGSRICFTEDKKKKKKKKKVQAMMAPCAGVSQPTFRFTCQLSSVTWSLQ